MGVCGSDDDDGNDVNDLVIPGTASHQNGKGLKIIYTFAICRTHYHDRRKYEKHRTTCTSTPCTKCCVNLAVESSILLFSQPDSQIHTTDK